MKWKALGLAFDFPANRYPGIRLSDSVVPRRVFAPLRENRVTRIARRKDTAMLATDFYATFAKPQ